jgi:arsenate reductase
VNEPARKTRVLFVCIGNMCRSPMAEGFARVWGDGFVESYSAGTHPTGVVSEASIDMMREVTIDISGQRSKGLEQVPLDEMDVIVSMAPRPAAKMAPPDFRGRLIDWAVDDPLGGGDAKFRRVRDEIGARVRELLDEIRLAHSSSTPDRA